MVETAEPASQTRCQLPLAFSSPHIPVCACVCVCVDSGLLRKGFYTFLVTTSDQRGAGTDADVHVSLHGEDGDTPTTMLPSRPEHFERGQTDSFR